MTPYEMAIDALRQLSTFEGPDADTSKQVRDTAREKLDDVLREARYAEKRARQTAEAYR